MKVLHRGILASSLLLTALTQDGFAQAGDPPVTGSTGDAWTMEVVADGLDYPWDIVRTDDTFVLTEAGGHVVTIRSGRLRRHQLSTSDPIAREGGGGLLGLALADDFATSGIGYFYYTYRIGSGLKNKVIEARFDGSGWQETRVLLNGIPGHRLYNGGRIAFGPDGHLYVTTGWTENPDLPQDLDSLAGKVLRMSRNGEVPPDNPFPNSLVYSYGHRNPQGIAWNNRGELYVVEHGQSARDEINKIEPGGNYGWPLVSGDERRDGMIAPVLHSGGETWAPSGIDFNGSELLVTALRARGLLVLDEEGNAVHEVYSSQERFRDVLAVGEAIFVLTTNRSPRAEGPSQDRLLRLTRTP